MDGYSTQHNSFVAIKLAWQPSNESSILSRFSSSELRDHPENHCVPLLDIVHVPGQLYRRLLVMPLLRDFQHPPFENVGQFMDFAGQMLEVGTFPVVKSFVTVTDTLIRVSLSRTRTGLVMKSKGYPLPYRGCLVL
jgi:hypothetical protein